MFRCTYCGYEFEEPRCPKCGRVRREKDNRLSAVLLFLLVFLPLAIGGSCAFNARQSEAVWIHNDDLFLGLAAGSGIGCLILGFWILKLWRQT